MSFRCLLASIARRHIQKPNQKPMVKQFLQTQLTSFKLLAICKKAASLMFKWVLNRPWAMFEVYLEHSQKSMVESFCENS